MTEQPQEPTPETTPAPETTPKPEPPDLAEELAAIPYEPLLPVEKKLIAWSLILGIGLLVLLAWLSDILFPTHAPPG